MKLLKFYSIFSILSFCGFIIYIVFIDFIYWGIYEKMSPFVFWDDALTYAIILYLSVIGLIQHFSFLKQSRIRNNRKQKSLLFDQVINTRPATISINSFLYLNSAIGGLIAIIYAIFLASMDSALLLEVASQDEVWVYSLIALFGIMQIHFAYIIHFSNLNPKI